MSLHDLPVVFLDLQTTGANPQSGAHILEMAWSLSTENVVHSYLVQLPEGEYLPRRIQAITGITEADLQEALPLSEVMEKFLASLQTLNGPIETCVIHFAQFEKPFLSVAFHQLNMEMPFTILCTHDIAKRLLPNLPTRGMKGLAGYFGYNAGEFKRGASFVEGTRAIWRGLEQKLAEVPVRSLQELTQWMIATPKASRTKYEYPLPKEKRLSLPDQPGVYRMISQWQEVLYVGKATSLKDRVNSYFRGQKNRDPRKLEMLTQTWDLLVTPCNSPLEAALLETDEIKRLNPRYNISLKTGNRSLYFFDHEFESMSTTQDEVHHIGPFSNSLVFDSLMRLSRSLERPEFDSMMFFEEIDAELLKSGFQIFCECHDFTAETFTSMRSILAVGLNWWRQRHAETLTEEEELLETEEEISEDELVELTPEDIADKFERHFTRAGGTYDRARKLTRMLNADVEFQWVESPVKASLILRGGRLQYDPITEVPAPEFPWQGLSVDTYDRMMILNTELEKIRSQQGEVHIHFKTSLGSQ